MWLLVEKSLSQQNLVHRVRGISHQGQGIEMINLSTTLLNDKQSIMITQSRRVQCRNAFPNTKSPQTLNNAQIRNPVRSLLILHSSHANLITPSPFPFHHQPSPSTTTSQTPNTPNPTSGDAPHQSPQPPLLQPKLPLPNPRQHPHKRNHTRHHNRPKSHMQDILIKPRLRRRRHSNKTQHQQHIPAHPMILIHPRRPLPTPITPPRIILRQPHHRLHSKQDIRNES